MEIEGIWVGEIVYGESYGKLQNQKLFFKLNIEQDNSKFTGESIDTEGLGAHPELASIKGQIIKTEIQFTKQYPNFHYFKKNTIAIKKNKPGFTIKYKGSFNDKANSFEGNWTINHKFKLLGIIPYNSINSGRWSMKKASPTIKSL